jgi:hypothetical protein
LSVITLHGRHEKVRDHGRVDTAIHLQVNPPDAGPGCELDRIPGTGALVADPRREGPDGIRRLKQRYQRGGVRANHHHGIKDRTAQDRQGKSQPLALELAHSIRRNCHDHGFGSTIHGTIIPSAHHPVLLLAAGIFLYAATADAAAAAAGIAREVFAQQGLAADIVPPDRR